MLTLNQACYDLTFSDCTVGSGPWNGVTHQRHKRQHPRHHLHRLPHPGGGPHGHRVHAASGLQHRGLQGHEVHQHVIEPSAEEAMCFDGGYFAADCLIDGCHDQRLRQPGKPGLLGRHRDQRPDLLHGAEHDDLRLPQERLQPRGPARRELPPRLQDDTVDYSVRKESHPDRQLDRPPHRAAERQRRRLQHCKFVLGHAWNAGYWTSCSQQQPLDEHDRGLDPVGA